MQLEAEKASIEYYKMETDAFSKGLNNLALYRIRSWPV